MNPTGRDEIFPKACCGNAHALAFLHIIFHAADVADDVHDGDKPAKVADVLHGMTAINLNGFFVAHREGLAALMLTGGLSWDLSNGMEGHPAQAFYAEQLEQVLFYVAMLCGGYAHAKAIALEWINQESSQ